MTYSVPPQNYLHNRTPPLLRRYFPEPCDMSVDNGNSSSCKEIKSENSSTRGKINVIETDAEAVEIVLEGTFNEKLDSKTEVMSDDNIVKQENSSNNSNNDRAKGCNKKNHIDEDSNFIYNWCSSSVPRSPIRQQKSLVKSETARVSSLSPDRYLYKQLSPLPKSPERRKPPLRYQQGELFNPVMHSPEAGAPSPIRDIYSQYDTNTGSESPIAVVKGRLRDYNIELSCLPSLPSPYRVSYLKEDKRSLSLQCNSLLDNDITSSMLCEDDDDKVGRHHQVNEMTRQEPSPPHHSKVMACSEPRYRRKSFNTRGGDGNFPINSQSNQNVFIKPSLPITTYRRAGPPYFGWSPPHSKGNNTSAPVLRSSASYPPPPRSNVENVNNGYSMFPYGCNNGQPTLYNSGRHHQASVSYDEHNDTNYAGGPSQSHPYQGGFIHPHTYQPHYHSVLEGKHHANNGSNFYNPDHLSTYEHEEVHPLLKGYDPNQDRYQSTCDDYNPENPAESSTSFDAEKSVYNTPDRKIKSKLSDVSMPSPGDISLSPTKKSRTTMKAAIAAGITEPPSASEIDFDIHNPPLTPALPPSSKPVCKVSSNINKNDVLCGRGGGTNTQIGNRRFRLLVQEFQPTYLLCRRKEKPLIARTIVLIIRNRGGRFLKKEEATGMLFEVGDEKAEAKTSQALREGLDVRASKGNSSVGKNKKKDRLMKNDNEKRMSGIKNQEQSVTNYDIPMSEISSALREGPPSSHYVHCQGSHRYPGPYEQSAYYQGKNHNYPLSTPSPSRKRQRGYPIAPYSMDRVTSCEYYSGPRQGLAKVMSNDEDWDMDFSPPMTKK